jgi:hypothetical protein
MEVGYRALSQRIYPERDYRVASHRRRAKLSQNYWIDALLDIWTEAGDSEAYNVCIYASLSANHAIKSVDDRSLLEKVALME